MAPKMESSLDYGAIAEMELATTEKRLFSSAVRVAAVLALVVAGIGLVALIRGSSAQPTPDFLSSMSVEKHACPDWPEFCSDTKECITKFHVGDAQSEVPVNMCEDYVADCKHYCTECDCPPPAKTYCEAFMPPCLEPAKFLFFSQGAAVAACPHGFEQVGVTGGGIEGCGLDGCTGPTNTEVGSKLDEVACAASCKLDERCKAFTFHVDRKRSPVCKRFGTDVVSKAVAPPHSEFSDRLVCKVLTNIGRKLNPDCAFESEGSILVNRNKLYPYCPEGSRAFDFKIDLDVLCCTGTCEQGSEGAAEDDVICKVEESSTKNYPVCDGFGTKQCLWALGAAASMYDYQINAQFTYDGPNAAFLFRMQSSTEESASRYMLKFDGTKEVDNVALMFHDGVTGEEIELGHPVGIKFESGKIAETQIPEAKFKEDIDTAIAADTEGYCESENPDVIYYSNQDICFDGASFNKGIKITVNLYLSEATVLRFEYNLAYEWGNMVYFDGETEGFNVFKTGYNYHGALATAPEERCTSCAAVPCGYCLEGCSMTSCTFQEGTTDKPSLDKPTAVTKNGCATIQEVLNSGEFPPGCKTPIVMPFLMERTLKEGPHIIEIYGAQSRDNRGGAFIKMQSKANFTDAVYSHLVPLTRQNLVDLNPTTIPEAVLPNKMHEIGIRVEGDIIDLAIDGTRYMQFRDVNKNSEFGTIGLSTWKSTMDVHHLQFLTLGGNPIQDTFKGYMQTESAYEMYIDEVLAYQSDVAANKLVQFNVAAKIIAMKFDPVITMPKECKEGDVFMDAYPTGHPYYFHEGTWMPICYHWFIYGGANGCKAVCQRLGYPYNGATTQRTKNIYSQDAIRIGTCLEGQPIDQCTGGKNTYGYDDGCKQGNKVGLTCSCDPLALAVGAPLKTCLDQSHWVQPAFAFALSAGRSEPIRVKSVTENGFAFDWKDLEKNMGHALSSPQHLTIWNVRTKVEQAAILWITSAKPTTDSVTDPANIGSPVKCRMHQGTVHAMCGNNSRKSWGIGPEGEAKAIGNCNYSYKSHVCAGNGRWESDDASNHGDWEARDTFYTKATPRSMSSLTGEETKWVCTVTKELTDSDGNEWYSKAYDRSSWQPAQTFAENGQVSSEVANVLHMSPNWIGPAENKGACEDGNVKLSSYPTGIPFIYANQRFSPICGRGFWSTRFGCDLVCQGLGYDSSDGSIPYENENKLGSFSIVPPEGDAIKVGTCVDTDTDLTKCTGGTNALTSNKFPESGDKCIAGQGVSAQCTCEGDSGGMMQSCDWGLQALCVFELPSGPETEPEAETVTESEEE